MCWRSSSSRCPIPDDLPFKDYLPLVQNDTTVDPFDATEMIGVVRGVRALAPRPGGSSRVPRPAVPEQEPDDDQTRHSKSRSRSDTRRGFSVFEAPDCADNLVELRCQHEARPAGRTDCRSRSAIRRQARRAAS